MGRHNVFAEENPLVKFVSLKSIEHLSKRTVIKEKTYNRWQTLLLEMKKGQALEIKCQNYDSAYATKTKIVNYASGLKIRVLTKIVRDIVYIWKNETQEGKQFMAEERKKQIITLRKRFPFWSLKKIAERVGVGRPYVYYVLRCKGIDTKVVKSS
jgi:hypothetical protein